MGGLGINLPGLLTQIVSFLVLFVVLYKVLYGPLTRMLDERSKRINEGLEAAERAREEATSSAERIEEELATARSEGQRLVAEARDAAGVWRREQEARVRDEMDEMLSRARAQIERERDAAIEAVRSRFSELAISAAERVIERSMDEETHREAIERVLEEGLSERRN